MMSALGELRQQAGALLARRAFAEALESYELLRAALVERFGEGHLHVAQADETLGGVARAAGQLARARSYFEAARAVLATVDPPRLSSIDHVLRHLDPLPAEVLRDRPVLRLEHEGALYTMDRDVFFIGRGIERVHLYVPSAMLSRVHARVLWDGAFMMEDCASENGTLHEGRPIRSPQAIRDGDVFLAGDAPVRFRYATA
jgi:hypothetical protein